MGIGLMFAFGSFVGFESAALYGEEARNPRRSVPLATYASVLVITVFYGLTSWGGGGRGRGEPGAGGGRQGAREHVLRAQHPVRDVVGDHGDGRGAAVH